MLLMPYYMMTKNSLILSCLCLLTGRIYLSARLMVLDCSGMDAENMTFMFLIVLELHSRYKLLLQEQ